MVGSLGFQIFRWEMVETKHPLETGISLFSSKVSQLQNDHPQNAIGAGSFQSVVLLKYSHS